MDVIEEYSQFKSHYEKIISIKVNLSSERFQSKRDSLQLLDLMGESGGFLDIIVLIGNLAVVGYSVRTFKSKLINDFD